MAPAQCAHWSYDANGNLLSATDDNAGVTDVYSYTASQPNEQVAGGSSVSPATATIALAYDAHGDTASISNPVALTPTDPGYKKYAIAESFAYDAVERPITVTRLVGNKDGTTTPLTATLQYNADGVRSDYLLTPAPGEGAPVDTRFAYRDGVLASATVTDITGTLLYKNTFIYGPSGEPLELIRTDPTGTTRYWYTLDGLGSVVALTSITGTVVDRYAYDSWGEPITDDRTNETIPQQLRYRGYYYDEALTWYWVTTRYYDPEAMRWLQPDPSEQDGIRTYAYVADDPVDFTDPTGLCLIKLHFEPVTQQGGSSPGKDGRTHYLVGHHASITTTENTMTQGGRLVHIPEGQLTSSSKTWQFAGRNPESGPRRNVLTATDLGVQQEESIPTRSRYRPRSSLWTMRSRVPAITGSLAPSIMRSTPSSSSTTSWAPTATRSHTRSWRRHTCQLMKYMGVAKWSIR